MCRGRASASEAREPRSKEAQSGASSARHRPPPGSRKPGEPQGRKEGGGKRARGGAEGGRPPDRRKRRRAGGAGRVPHLRTPRPWTAARTLQASGELQRSAARPSSGNRGRVASRSRTSRHRPRQPCRPAGSGPCGAQLLTPWRPPPTQPPRASGLRHGVSRTEATPFSKQAPFKSLKVANNYGGTT
nr:PREDICTED: basic salivary proline-rich protein 4 [Rhinolophus sinicus]